MPPSDQQRSTQRSGGVKGTKRAPIPPGAATTKPRAWLPKMSESALFGQVTALLRLFGWKWWHDAATNSRRRCKCGGEIVCNRCHKPAPPIRNAAGLPDLICWKGRHLIIMELKTEDGKLSDKQAIVWETLKDVQRVVYSGIMRPHRTQELADVLAWCERNS